MRLPRSPATSRTLLALVASVGSVMVAEGCARVLFRSPLPEFVPSANPRLAFELNPAHPEINSLGMRQGEVTREALRGRFVIAVIGDSHAYSSGSAHPAHAFPARLEYHLNASGGRVAVLNFGVPGYNMAQELEVLRAKALAFRPNLVILQYCVNDEHLPNFISPRWPGLNRVVHGSVLLTRAWTSVLYSGFGRANLLPWAEHLPDVLLYTPGLVGAPRSREEGTPHGFTHPSRSTDLAPARYRDVIGRANLERDVRAFGEIGRGEGIPMVATGFIERADEPLYARAGFSVYSFFTMFEGVDMRRYGYDPEVTDGHFTARGNEFIGRALAEYLGPRVAMGPAR